MPITGALIFRRGVSRKPKRSQPDQSGQQKTSWLRQSTRFSLSSSTGGAAHGDGGAPHGGAPHGASPGERASGGVPGGGGGGKNEQQYGRTSTSFKRKLLHWGLQSRGANAFLQTCIFLSIVSVMLEAGLPGESSVRGAEEFWFVTEIIFTVVFTLEYLLRLYCREELYGTNEGPREGESYARSASGVSNRSGESGMISGGGRGAAVRRGPSSGVAQQQLEQKNGGGRGKNGSSWMNSRSWMSPALRRFLFDPLNILDLLSILPLYASILVGYFGNNPAALVGELNN